MNKKMPRTPYSTQLSGSAKETEIRLRNIFSGPKKRPPLAFLLLMFSICIFCGNIVSCHMAETPPPDQSNLSSSSQDSPDAPDADAQLNALVLEYFQNEYRPPVYWVQDRPDQPQEQDYCLDSIHMVGMDYIGEELYVLYQVNNRNYFQGEWFQSKPNCLVARTDPDGLPVELLTASYEPTAEDMSTDEAIAQGRAAIRRTVWGLMDLEVCLFRDGYSTPLGPGNWVDLFPELEPTVEIHEDWDPIYWPGDYWDTWDAEGLSATRYYNAEKGSWRLNDLRVTRTDLYTPQGIRVGSTRSEVLEAYPNAKAKNYWDLYPGEDMLYYIPGSDPDDMAELGCALLFFFDGDTVRQITLKNMFN